MKNARQAGKGAACLSNLRQIATALNIYANENEGALPPIYGIAVDPPLRWTVRLQPYGLNDRVVFCPQDPIFTSLSTPSDTDDTRSHSYIFNAMAELNPQIGQSLPLWNFSDRADLVLLSEKKPSETDYYLALPAEDPDHELDQTRHAGRANYLFADSHIAALPARQSLFPNNLWTINPGD